MPAGRWRRFVVRPLVWLLAIVALGALALRLVLASDFARGRVRDFTVTRLAEALGRAVTIERIEFSLVPATLIVEGLTISGDRPDAPPLLTLRHGEVDANLANLGAGRLELRRVALRGLDIALEFREDGSDNLPRLRGEGGRGLTVTIGGLSVDDSRLLVDHREVPLELTANAVRARLVAVGESGLDGTVAAQDVSLRLPQAERPLALAVAARVRLDGDRLRIARARVSGRDLALTAEGDVGLRRGQGVRLTTTVATRGELLDEIGWLRGEIAGALELAGEVKWRPGEWSVTGRASSPRVRVVDFELEELAGDVRVDAAGAELALERARWADGGLTGSFGVRFAPGYPAALDVFVADADVDAVLARFAVPAEGVRGRLSGPLRYEFDLLDAARGNGRGEFLVGVDRVGETLLAAEGEVGVTLAAGVVSLAPLRWSAAGQRVTGSGEIELDGGSGRLELAVASEDLGGLVALLPFLDREALWLPSAGTGELDVTIDLTAGGGYEVAVEIAGAALVAPGIAADRVTGMLRATPAAVVVERLELARGEGRLELAGRLPTAQDEPLQLVVTVEQWPFEDAAPWLPAELPIAGPARGSLTLGGTAAELVGEAELVLAPAAVAGVPARRLAARVDWDGERLRLAAARLDFDAGGIEGAGTLRFADEALDFHFESPALALDREPFGRPDGGALAGTMRVTADLTGTLASPRLELLGEAHDAALAGKTLEEGGGLDITASWAEGRLAAEIDLGGELHLTGGGELVVGGDAQLEFELASSRLDRLVALATGTVVEGLEGALTASLAVDWPAGERPRAELLVPELVFGWQGRELRSREPIVARLDESGLTVVSFYLGSGEDELFVGGRVDFADDPRLNLHLQIELAAEWLAGPLGDLDITGRVDALADLRGTVAKPELNGQVGWSKGRIVPPLLPHTFEKGRALFLLYPGSLVLDRLNGEFAGGTLDASGRLQLSDGRLGNYRFQAAGRELSLRWPTGWQLKGEADLTLQSTPGGRQLGGQVTLERAYYFQDIDLSPTQLVQRLLTRSPVVVPETDELLAATALDIAVSAPGTIRIRNNVATLTATAELAVRGSLARPAVFGDVVTSAASEVEYGGSKYRIERGVLTFANPTRIDPLLDVVASTRVQEYNVRLQLSGPLSRPLTTFSSDPPLPDLEILGLLTTGAPIESAVLTDVRAGSGETASGVAAEALLYGQAASLVGARVGRLFGFDRIRVEPLTARDSVSTARVTVGKKLSSRLFVTYSYDPSSTAEDIIQIEWRMSDHLQLVLTQNGDESYAVDARWEKRF
jgi:hypothetical protein